MTPFHCSHCRRPFTSGIARRRHEKHCNAAVALASRSTATACEAAGVNGDVSGASAPGFGEVVGSDVPTQAGLILSVLQAMANAVADAGPERVYTNGFHDGLRTAIVAVKSYYREAS